MDLNLEKAIVIWSSNLGKLIADTFKISIEEAEKHFREFYHKQYERLDNAFIREKDNDEEHDDFIDFQFKSSMLSWHKIRIQDLEDIKEFTPELLYVLIKIFEVNNVDYIYILS